MATPKLQNQPFSLTYLAFVEAAWKSGQGKYIENKLPYFLTHEPLPYGKDSDHEIIMDKPAFKLLGLTYFLKEWTIPYLQEFLNITSEKKCWLCFLKEKFPYFEDYPVRPKPFYFCLVDKDKYHFNKFVYTEDGEPVRFKE